MQRYLLSTPPSTGLNHGCADNSWLSGAGKGREQHLSLGDPADAAGPTAAATAAAVARQADGLCWIRLTAAVPCPGAQPARACAGPGSVAASQELLERVPAVLQALQAAATAQQMRHMQT